MALPHKSKIGELIEVLQKTRHEQETWMTYIPLQRVMEIIYQTTSLRLDNSTDLAELLPGMSFFDSDSSEIYQKYLSSLLREVKSFETLNAATKDLNPNRLLILIFKENPNLFQKCHLKLFEKIGNFFNQKFSDQSSNKPDSILKDYLKHNCLESHNYIINEDEENCLFLILSLDETLFRGSLSIQTLFLKQCNYSVISIKIINYFAKQIRSNTDTDSWIQLFDSEFYELLCLIDTAPCINCNSLLSTEIDLENLLKQVIRIVHNITGKDDELRVIFSIYCEWLIHGYSESEIRSLFIAYGIN